MTIWSAVPGFMHGDATTWGCGVCTTGRVTPVSADGYRNFGLAPGYTSPPFAATSQTGWQLILLPEVRSRRGFTDTRIVRRLQLRTTMDRNGGTDASIVHTGPVRHSALHGVAEPRRRATAMVACCKGSGKSAACGIGRTMYVPRQLRWPLSIEHLRQEAQDDPRSPGSC